MTPSMLERVQAERVGGNVSEKKRVFLESLLCLSHRLVRYTFSSVWSEMFEWRNQTSFSQVLQVKPSILCVCAWRALPFSLSFSVSLIFWLFSHLEKQWHQTRWSPVQNNYCVLSWFSHTVVKTAQQPAFSYETSVAALNLFGFGDSSSYGNNFITKSLSMQPSQDDCTSRLVRGKSVSKQSRPDSDCLQIHRLCSQTSSSVLVSASSLNVTDQSGMNRLYPKNHLSESRGWVISALMQPWNLCLKTVQLLC